MLPVTLSEREPNRFQVENHQPAFVPSPDSKIGERPHLEPVLVNMIKGDREKIESELAKICEDIQISEYHRYLAELATGDKRKDTTDKSLDAYKAAPVITVTEFPPTDLIRPELALTATSPSSIRNTQRPRPRLPPRRCELDTLSEESYKDSPLVMKTHEPFDLHFKCEAKSSIHPANSSSNYNDCGGMWGNEYVVRSIRSYCDYQPIF